MALYGQQRHLRFLRSAARRASASAIADDSRLTAHRSQLTETPIPAGQLTFTTIFPACYSGRWPHIHFEVYPSLEMASSGANKVATSQLALPEATCEEVYANEGYEASVSNLSQVSLTSDMVFSDSSSQELASISGSVDSGFVAKLKVTI